MCFFNNNILPLPELPHDRGGLGPMDNLLLIPSNITFYLNKIVITDPAYPDFKG